MRPEDHKSHARRVSTPYLRKIVTEFYRTAHEDYQQAGSPFGQSAEAMLIWFEFGQETTVN